MINLKDYTEFKAGKTIQQNWDSSKDAAFLLVWLTHEELRFNRKELIEFSLSIIKPCFTLMHDTSKKCMVDLQRWIEGANVNLNDIVVAAAEAAMSDEPVVFYQSYYELIAFKAAEKDDNDAQAAALYIAIAAIQDNDYTAAVYANAAVRLSTYATAAARRTSKDVAVVGDIRSHVTCESICARINMNPNG